MDVSGAQLLATMSGPNGLSALQKHSDDPRAAKATAQQFGALLMQQMMQQNDGSAMGMAEGTGGGIVNTMFATAMGKTVMSGEKMGLTDLLLRSIEKKQSQAAGGDQGKAAAPAADSRSGGGVAPAAATAAGSFALGRYWQGNGMRPPGFAAAATAAHAAPGAAPSAGAGIVLSPYLKTAALILPHPGTQAPASAAMAAPAVPPSHGDSGSDHPGDPAVAAFTARLAPLMQQAAQQLGVSPRILLAQAAIETGWGRSVVGNNLFGIKAGSSWSGAQVTAPTHEYENGQMVAISDSFRAYPSYQASVQDFVALVKNSPRYQAALGKGDDANGYARALLSGGWATDIDYVKKLEAVAGGSRATAPFASPGLPVRLVPANFATVPL